MARRRKSSLRRTLLSIVMIIIGIIICSASSIGAIDFYCRNDINHWMPVYPDAELIETQEDGFFRVRASGITRQVYYTPDSPNEVRQWYRDYRQDITSGQFNSENPNEALSGVATTNRSIKEDPDSDGSLISYYSECAYN